MVTFETIGLTPPVYAYPGSEADFTNWDTPLRVEAVSALGRDIHTVDPNISLIWYVFEGDTEPTSWAERAAIKDFTLELQQFYTGPR